jgi:riboflavin biosynthesis pyrimidine reductase
VPAAAEIEPLELLYEVAELPVVELPGELRRVHGGDLGFGETCLYANFVATLDGVVAIPTMRRSNEFNAGDNDADRFLMGLLRAFADVVLIGSGVLRASPRGTWQPDKIHPPSAGAYDDLRRALRVPARPEVAVVTGSGAIDVEHPVFESRALVLTTNDGAAVLEGRLPATTSIVTLGNGREIPARAIRDALEERGHRRILCEAGPHTFGTLLEGHAVDELFLTTSPLLVGEAGPGSRLRLVEAADLVGLEIEPRLLSLRRHGSHLFHRYGLAASG